MGKFYKFTGHLLGLFCAAAFAVQALAVESTARVSTSIDSSGYRGITSSTIRTPAGLTVAPRVGTALGVSKYSQGIQQVMPGTVSIDGVKGSQPINMHVRATNSTLKGGAKSLLKGGLAGVALTIGIEQLLDGLDWVMGEGGKVSKLEYPPAVEQTPCSTGSMCWQLLPSGGTTSNPSAVCSHVYGPHTNSTNVRVGSVNSNGTGTCLFNAVSNPDGPTYQDALGRGALLITVGSLPGEFAPVPSANIDAAVDDYYEPEPEDWPLLSPRIEPDDVEIYDLPGTIPGEPETIIEYDPQGNPQTTTVKQPAYDLVPRENPSPQPALDLETKLETRTYNEHGQLTGIIEATSTSPAGAEQPALEIPTDCEFMPTICRFLEWFQEPDPELDQQPDIESLRQDLELERNFTVGSSTAGCPAPIQISLGMFPSVELSLQPLCDFVDLLRPLLLAFAFYFSARIVLRT